MSNDLDDLLGGGKPKPKRKPQPKRRPKPDLPKSIPEFVPTDLSQYEDDPNLHRIIKAAAGGNALIDTRNFVMPVSQGFLSFVFGMEQPTVKKRLLRCPPVGYSETKNPRPVYDFKTACQYLVEPNIDISAYMRNMNPADMPNMVNKTYWEAKRIKLDYMRKAGEAWLTEDVLDLLGTVFLSIKDVTTLWREDMREQAKLTDVQAKKMDQKVDDFLESLSIALLEVPQNGDTQSIAGKDEDISPSDWEDLK